MKAVGSIRSDGTAVERPEGISGSADSLERQILARAGELPANAGNDVATNDQVFGLGRGLLQELAEPDDDDLDFGTGARPEGDFGTGAVGGGDVDDPPEVGGIEDDEPIWPGYDDPDPLDPLGENFLMIA